MSSLHANWWEIDVQMSWESFLNRVIWHAFVPHRGVVGLLVFGRLGHNTKTELPNCCQIDSPNYPTVFPNGSRSIQGWFVYPRWCQGLKVKTYYWRLIRLLSKTVGPSVHFPWKPKTDVVFFSSRMSKNSENEPEINGFERGKHTKTMLWSSTWRFFDILKSWNMKQLRASKINFHTLNRIVRSFEVFRPD